VSERARSKAALAGAGLGDDSHHLPLPGDRALERRLEGRHLVRAADELFTSANRTVTCLRSPSRALLEARIFSTRCFGV
jgi:hypothetical protein